MEWEWEGGGKQREQRMEGKREIREGKRGVRGNAKLIKKKREEKLREWGAEESGRREGK